jgi:hypothetical protein
MSKMMHAVEQMMEQTIDEAVRATFREGRSSGDAAADVDAFIHSLLVRLGLRTSGEVLMMKSVTKMRAALVVSPDLSDDELLAVTAAAAPPAVVSAPPSVAETGSDDGGSSETKERKRTVSKKMKDFFLADADAEDPTKGAGGTEEQLKAAMKVYKAADQAQLDAWGGKWDAFARAFLAGECVLAKKARAAPKAKAAAAADPDAPAAPAKEKAPKVAKNFTWTPTAKKLFAETVEGGGSAVTDALKTEFAAHVNAMSAEDYKDLAPVGHMRAFVASKSAAAVAAPAAPESAVSSAAPAAPESAVSSAAPAAAAAVENFDDEDLEVIEVEGEELTIGVKSGFIFRATEDSGDVKIGVAGQGKFKDVKIPSA